MRQKRLKIIAEIIKEQYISHQSELQQALRKEGEYTTQATISRDLRTLKAKRMKMSDGRVRYMLPAPAEQAPLSPAEAASRGSIITRVSFNGPLAVIRTLPGYAQGVATELDLRAGGMLLGTIAGFDTVLVIPVEGETQAEVRGLLDRLLSSYDPK